MPTTAASNEPNGKVSNKEFYQELTAMRREMIEMERRITNKLDDMTRVEPPRLVQQVNTLERRLEAEIDCLQEGVDQAKAGVIELRVASARGDKITGVVAATISAGITG